MAFVPDGTTKPLALASKNEHDIADPVELKNRKRALSGRTDDPEPLPVQGVESSSEIHYPCDTDVKMGSCRAFNRLSGYSSGSVFWQDKAVNAEESASPYKRP